MTENKRSRFCGPEDKPIVDVLVVILEVHSLLVQPPETHNDSKIDVENLIGQICTFLSTFQNLNFMNRLAVLACGCTGVQCLFEDLADAGYDDTVSGATSTVLAGLRTICSEVSNAPLDAAVDTRYMSAALSQAMCMVNRVNHLAEVNECEPQPRVLVLHSSVDVTSQYVACMNAAFSARRLGVPIDAMALTGQVSAYLELASNLTNGTYLTLKTPKTLLLRLACFTVGMLDRKYLVLPDSTGLNFKGTCFCHVNAIDSGFVCSVCLSVFCAPHDKCMTCGTEFTHGV